MVDLNNMQDMDKLLRRVVDLSVEAGNAIMDIYNGPAFQVEHKDDKSPLTAADLASHHVIVNGLGKLTPEWPVLSEESESTPYETRREWTIFWLVDPLDGTKEFLKRNGEFTVNIALIEGDTPVLGVVYAPARRTMYFAARGMGAFKQENREASPIRVQRGPGNATRVIVSRSHAANEENIYTQQYGSCEFVPMGSSLKFCLVAEGSADIYPRTGPTMEWDTAAAHCILDQAGGSVTAEDGARFRYNKTSLLNPGFLATGLPASSTIQNSH
jgi:3'(2'), 5'-bisphosphate nucleotidase